MPCFLRQDDPDGLCVKSAVSYRRHVMPSKISVIIPTFNRAQLLSAAIDSVLRQSHSATEIIVVDDGSSDGTEKVVLGFSPPIPIRYLRDANLGPSAARNLGVSIAREDWIAFLDDDDVWCPEKLAVQSDYATRYPDVALFYSHLDHVDARGQSVPQRWVNDELCRLVFRGNPPPYPSTIFVRKDRFCEVSGFTSTLRYGEDWDLYLRIAARWPVHCIDQQLARYRLHSLQLHRNGFALEDSWPHFERAMRDLLGGDPDIQAALRRRAARMYAGIATHYLIAGNHETARKCCKIAFGYQPWSWKIFRRWGITYLPLVRDWYRHKKMKQSESPP